MWNHSRSTLVPLDPPEKLTVGEHSPAKVSSVLWVADAWDPLSATHRSSPFFYSNPDFWLSYKNHIFCFWDPKIGKQIVWCSLGWLVFNKNIKCTMFPRKNIYYNLILLFKYKFISFGILLILLWNFYGSLWVSLECYDKHFMIFGVLKPRTKSNTYLDTRGDASPKLDVDIVVHSCGLHVRSHSS